MRKWLNSVVIPLVVVAGIWAWYDVSTWTPQRAEQREMRTATEDTSETAADRSRQIYEAMNEVFDHAGDVDTTTFRDTLLPRAFKANEIREAHDEALAITEGRATYSPPRKIEAGSNSWQLQVAITGNPQKIVYAGGTVSSAMGKIVVANDGQGTENPGIKPRYLIVPKAPFLALIARAYVPGRGYTQPFLFGNGMVLCGQYPGGSWMEFRVNEVPVASFHGDNSGSMTVAYAPVHSSACAQTPAGVLVNAGN